MESFRELISGYIDPCLKSRGFKKYNLIWNRVRGDFVDVIDIQNAPYNTSTSKRFTLNAGIFNPEVYSLLWGKDAPKVKKEPDCIIRSRMGSLMQNLRSNNKSLDVWWDLEEGKSIVPIGIEIRDTLIVELLPFLERFETITDVSAYLGSSSHPFAGIPLVQIERGIVEYLAGDTKSSKESLDQVFNNSNSSFQNLIKDVRVRLIQA